MDTYVSGATVDHGFTTRDATGTPTTLDSTPTIVVYKADNTTPTTAGVTLTVDFASQTGSNLLRVVTSDGFYSDTANYRAILTAGQVSGVNVAGEVVHQFRLGAAPADVRLWKGSEPGGVGGDGLLTTIPTDINDPMRGFPPTFRVQVVADTASTTTVIAVKDVFLSDATAISVTLVADQLKDRALLWTNNTDTTALRGQAKRILSNTTATITTTAFTDAPVEDDIARVV